MADAPWRKARRPEISPTSAGRPHIADFACNYPKVIIECDGGQHALSDYDARRDGWFKAEGYRALRFWNGEISDHLESVRLGILNALGKG